MFEPIIVAYRVFFLFLYEHIGFALSILITSLITSFLMKPIAKFIVKYVKRELAYQAVLQPQIDAINTSAKSGAEKQFELQELYRRYGYSPILATRKVLPLFVQLPFLFLTYYMLEGATVLNGVPFLCFKNLGVADALLPFGINLLPFVMTGINVVAIFATPSFTRKDQIQAVVVALLFLVMLYPASSALMIYWTLNNFFTCVKTLLEENHSGAKLLWNRLRYICAPTTIRVELHKILNLNPEIYAMASLICCFLAVHSYFVFTGRYGDASLSGKISANTMNFFLVCSLANLACIWRNMRVTLITVTGLFLMIHIGIILDKILIRSDLIFGRHPIILRYLFYIQSIVVGTFLVLRQLRTNTSWEHAIPKCELAIYCFSLFALACHYLCVNTLLGLSAFSFLLFPVYLLCIYLTFALLGYALFGRDLPIRTILRTVFVICTLFYLMPLFAKGMGPFFPSQNIWLYWTLLICIGFVLSMLWTRARNFLLSFLVLVSVALIANGIYAVVVGREETAQAALVDSNETFSYLDEHKIINPYNVYVLVYDGWPNPLIADAYGIYNPLPYLQDRGFTIYPRAYMPCADTVNSMSRFFDIFNDTKLPVRDVIAGRAKCLRFLRSKNYKMCNVTCEYMLQGTYLPLEGDMFFPDPAGGKKVKIENVLIRNIRHGFLNQTTEDFQSFTHDELVDAKRSILSEVNSRPKFMYAHSGPGHTITEKEFRRAEEVEFSDFVERVSYSKEEMVGDLDSIIDWDNSIVIVGSDHGAYLNMEENVSEATQFLDQYACLLAVKWPKEYKPIMDVSFAPNVMLEVMICLTGDESLARYKQKGIMWGGVGGSSYHVLDSFRDGISLSGPNKGKNLFDVAEVELRARYSKHQSNKKIKVGTRERVGQK